MKWFKHISDSLDDPFIFDLMTEFKSDGYVVFFGIIEIYSREFLKENDWKLIVSLSFLHRKLRISSSKVKNILLNINKWNVSFEGSQVSIFIPKFTELMDEWTARKIGSKSGVTPKILSHEVDKEVDIRIKNKNKKESIKKKDLPAHTFVKPSLEEITAYCQERKNAVNPQKWLDHYIANGWKIGKALAPMKDWKAAVRTWEGNNYDNNGSGKAIEPEKFPAYIDRSGDPFAEEMAAYKRGELK